MHELRFEFQTSRLEVFKDADGKPHARGIASDTLEDLHGDAISERALGQMVRQVVRGIVLLPDHRSSFEIGKSVMGDSRRNPDTGGLELVVDFLLDERFAEARVLYSEVESGQCDRQLSIGGFLNSNNPRAAYFEDRNGKVVRVLDDLVLDHIAVTRWKKAANPRTGFVDAVFKSLTEAGLEVIEGGYKINEKKAVETTVVDEQLAGRFLPEPVKGIEPKLQSLWRRVWKDTFIRQLVRADRTVEQAERSATLVAMSVLNKQVPTKLDVESWLKGRSAEVTFAFGATSSAGVDGHTHLWASRQVDRSLGEKNFGGMMLTTRGHFHKILDDGTCETVSDHSHELLPKGRKTSTPDAPAAPVGLLHFGRGFESEDDVRVWLDANGIVATSIERVEDSVFVVEFAASPFSEVETEEIVESRKKEGDDMSGEAAVETVEKATVVYKAWPLSAERGWDWNASRDGAALLGKDGDDWARFKQAHTYFDSGRGATPTVKAGYSLPHHKMAAGGLQTYIGGVIAATAVLNGARGGFRRDTSTAGRKSLYSHLSKHYDQAGRTAPPLKGEWVDRIGKSDHPKPETLVERDFEDFVFALEESKGEKPEFLTKEWWMAWDSEVTGIEEIPETEKGIWTAVEKEDAGDGDKDTKEAKDAGKSADGGEKKDGETPPEGGADGEKPAKATEKEAAAGDSDGDRVGRIEQSVATLAKATKEALATLTSAIADVSKMVQAVKEKKPDDSAKPEDKSEEQNTDGTKTKDETGSEGPTKDKGAAKIFSAFHDLLAGLGLSEKEFFNGMAEKGLERVQSSLTETVEKAVVTSLGSLKKEVVADVEKSVGEKLTSVTGKFDEVVGSLTERLEKVEQVGGVSQGTAGQEDAVKPRKKGKFTGVFSGALKKVGR